MALIHCSEWVGPRRTGTGNNGRVGDYIPPHEGRLTYVTLKWKKGLKDQPHLYTSNKDIEPRDLGLDVCVHILRDTYTIERIST